MKKAFLLFSILVLLYFIAVEMSMITATSVTTCSNITSAGNYLQTANLTPTATIGITCINITSSNVLYDCGGNSITNGSFIGWGISANGVNNITIQNCNITCKTATNGGGGGAVYFLNVSNSYVTNNSFPLNKNGVTFENTTNSTIINNFIRNSSLNGIYLITSNNNYIINNLFNLTAGNSIYIDGNSNYNSINNNQIYGSQSEGISVGGNYNNITSNMVGYSSGLSPSANGLDIESGLYNNIVGNTEYSNGNAGIYINGEGTNYILNNYATLNKYGIYIRQSDNNFIQDSVITNSSLYDVYIFNNVATSLNNTFLNVSYNKSLEYVSGSSQLIREWWYSTNSNAKNTNITASNSSGATQFSYLTPFNKTGIIDYVNNGGTISSYSNYTINGGFLGQNIVHTYNISQMQNIIGDVYTFTLPEVDFKVTYTYTYNGNGQASDTINKTTSSLNIVTTYFPLFIVIGAMILLIILVVTIVSVLKGSGVMANDNSKANITGSA